DEAKIYRTVKREFAKSKKYSASIFLLTKDGLRLEIAEASIPLRMLRMDEKAAKLRLKNYKIDLAKSKIYRQVVKDGTTVQVKVSDITKDLFPRALTQLIIKTMGYENKKGILTPLRRSGKIIGAFAMTSTKLADYLIPSVKNLALHISTALDLAQECARHKKTGEALQKAHKELEKRVKQRTEALRESEEKYRNLVERANDGVGIVQKGIIKYVNPRLAKMHGETVETLVGKPFADYVCSDGACRLAVDHYRRREAGEKMPSVSEIIIRSGNGRKINIELNASLIKYQGKPGVLVVMRDITDRKKVEEKLKKSRQRLKTYSENLEKVVKVRTKKLDQLVDSQKEFIADIGHELRTPLSVIKATAEAELDKSKPRFRQSFDLMNEKVDQITQILRNLMLTSRLDIGREEIEKKRFKLRDLIKEVVEESLESKITLTCPKAIGIDGDRTKLAEVLTNLLRNAVIHSSGQPQIDLKVKKLKNKIQIIVEDNNQPIRQKELEKIFDKFYKSKQAKKKGNGLGLGLYICKRLVELMKGKIWVESKKGIGNRFIVQLPN
ncbi:MAG TPA: PAS domain-containing sensor histidine kinase, partial [Nevskiaceae bacterium]|nr:PAS domain-containing sensor histidine kinase [Nevskiaceae bacterium]